MTFRTAQNLSTKTQQHNSHNPKSAPRAQHRILCRLVSSRQPISSRLAKYRPTTNQCPPAMSADQSASSGSHHISRVRHRQDRVLIPQLPSTSCFVNNNTSRKATKTLSTRPRWDSSPFRDSERPRPPYLSMMSRPNFDNSTWTRAPKRTRCECFI